MRKTTHNGIIVAIGVFAGVLIVAGGILYRNISALYENSTWVSHTLEVSGALQELLRTVADAETGQRGYIITGRKDYLQPYHEAVNEYHATMDRLRELTADNPAQQKRAASLESLIDSKFAELSRTLQIFEKDGFEPVSREIAADIGLRHMVDIRARMDEMQQEEDALLISRQAINAAAFRSAFVNAVLSTVVGLVALGAIWILVHHHLQVVERSTAEVYRQRELLQAMLISIGDGVIATNERGEVTLLNQVAEKLTGWRAGEALGKPLVTVFNIVNEQTRQPVDNPALRALRYGEIVGLANHTILIAKDGTEWPLDDSAAPVRTESGRVEGAILVFREISERKRQDAQLQAQASTLEEADQRKNEFLATLAHELRNPLSPLSNALQLWPFVENDRAELERLRLLMTRQIRHMTRLIDDLLDVSRITSGKFHLHKQPVDVTSVINEAVETVKPLIEANKQQLTVSLPEQPIHVTGDVARLTQVFGNILNNAAKYSGRAGVISLVSEPVDGHVVVRVRDNGPGIPSDMLDTIFEMFRQGDGSLERTHGGLGIGLTLVKRLVEDHQGTVTAHSEGPGRGSEFVVSLPTHSLPTDGPPSAGHKGSKSLANLPTLCILVVDDVKASAHTLAMMLRAIGQQVFEANDGPTAIEWVSSNQPAVVFLDIAMPGMSGYDVARRLRAERPELFLVALTGYGQEDDRRRALEAGFNHHLIKPTTLDQLQVLLQSVHAPGDVSSARPA